MLLYVVCRGTGYWNNPDQKQNVHMNVATSWNMLMLLENILHDDLSCWYVCMKSNEVYKKWFETMYVTEIGNKMQNNCKARDVQIV